MRDRIEGQSAEIGRRRIAQAIGYPTMGDFVKNDSR